MSIKISVIVPVYNAENTIERCMESLVNQTLKDIEIITVDDMSTDKSYEILKKYETEYPDIVKVIKVKEKGHAGGARNEGISIAKGEYIGFVDADDWVDETMYEKLYNKANGTLADIVDCAYYDMKQDRAVLTISDKDCGVVNQENIASMIMNFGSIVTKIFRKEMLVNNNIAFRKNVKLEDVDFLLYTYISAHIIENVKEVLYVYDNRASESTWAVKKLNVDEYRHIKGVIKEIKKICQQNESELIKEVLDALTIRLYSVAAICCATAKELGRKELLLIKDIRDLKCSIVKEGYDNYYVLQLMSGEEINLMKYIDDRFKNIKI